MKRAATLAFLLLALVGAGSGTGADKPFRVGLVLPPGATTAPVYRPSIDALRRAVRELGVEGRVVTPGAREGDLPSLLAFARQDYDLIAGVVYPPAMDAAAVRFPKTRFMALGIPQDALPHRPKNVWSVLAAHEEAGYLAGYLAALVERRRPGKDVISSVGGVKIPVVDDWIAGYQAGARKAAPGMRILNGYSGSFSDSSKCRNVALDQISKGSHVVFNVAGGCGPGSLAVAREKGVWGIGVDFDQSSLGPHILTSATADHGAVLFEAIRSAKGGAFRGGQSTTFGLRERAVGLGKISPKVPRSFVAQVERIRRDIVAGKIRNIPTTLR